MKRPGPVTVAVAGTAFLLALYFGILTLAESFAYAWTQFRVMPGWLVLLAAGFGVQIGLLHHLKARVRDAAAGATAGVAASGGVSTAAMVACCAHHAAELAPFLGLAGAAAFLTEYQFSFILVGIASNLIGIAMMLTIIQKHGFYPRTALANALFAFDMRKVRNALAVFAVVGLPVYFVVFELNAAPLAPADAVVAEALDLPARTAEAGGVEIKAAPRGFEFGRPVRIRLSINTHSGSLDFDPAAIAILTDDKGNALKPTAWKGAPAGGHHRSGTLAFPPLGPGARAMTLVLKDVAGVPERTFEWRLK